MFELFVVVVEAESVDFEVEKNKVAAAVVVVESVDFDFEVEMNKAVVASDDNQNIVDFVLDSRF